MGEKFIQGGIIMITRELLESIMPDVEEYVIKNEKPHIILEGYEYMRKY